MYLHRRSLFYSAKNVGTTHHPFQSTIKYSCGWKLLLSQIIEKNKCKKWVDQRSGKWRSTRVTAHRKVSYQYCKVYFFFCSWFQIMPITQRNRHSKLLLLLLFYRSNMNVVITTKRAQDERGVLFTVGNFHTMKITILLKDTHVGKFNYIDCYIPYCRLLHVHTSCALRHIIMNNMIATITLPEKHKAYKAE